MAGQYAAQTSIPPSRSRADIEQTLTRYGASAFLYGWQDQRAVIAFTAHGRQIRYELPMPDRNERRITRTETGRPRSAAQQEAVYDQAVRQRWRSLLLVIKAKLEAVEVGLVTFEDEFLAHTVTPSGATVSDWLQPQLDQAYATGAMPALLPQPMLAIEAEVLE